MTFIIGWPLLAFTLNESLLRMRGQTEAAAASCEPIAHQPEVTHPFYVWGMCPQVIVTSNAAEGHSGQMGARLAWSKQLRFSAVLRPEASYTSATQVLLGSLGGSVLGHYSGH